MTQVCLTQKHEMDLLLLFHKIRALKIEKFKIFTLTSNDEGIVKLDCQPVVALRDAHDSCNSCFHCSFRRQLLSANVCH